MLYHATYPKTIIFNNMKNQKICQNKTFFFCASRRASTIQGSNVSLFESLCYTEKSEVAIKNTSRKILLKIKFWLVCRYFFLPDISFPLDKSNCSQSG